jgi:hypothetical protein
LWPRAASPSARALLKMKWLGLRKNKKEIELEIFVGNSG